jgi:hypothetical protein
MHLESLESRTFMSADPHAVTVPLKDSVSGNLPARFLEGTASHLGKFTGTLNDQNVLVFTAANGDELWILPVTLGPKSEEDPTIWHTDALIIGGTGRFEGATGTGSHDIFFVDDQGDFVFNAEVTITLQRPWKAPA